SQPLPIATGRSIVSKNVEAARDEVYELHLGHRAHSHQRRPASRADDCGFRYRGVDDPLFAEAIDEPLGNLERATVDSDVFAEKKYAVVALHLFPESLAYSFE